MVIPGLQAGNQCMQINKDMHTTSVLHVRIKWRDREGERERERARERERERASELINVFVY